MESWTLEEITEVGVSPQNINDSEVDSFPVEHSDGIDTWDTWNSEEIAEVAWSRRDFDE